MPLYADIVLPLAQPAYTFAVPEGMHVEAGQAVAVQFGARKFYTGIVWRVHDRRPPFKTVKSIQRVLYGAPLLSAQQMAFWEWVAAYYMCTPGEVMRVGLPSLMKPSGDTEEEFTEEEFRPRTECYVALAPGLHDEGRLHEAFEKLERRAPRQYEALLELASAGDGERIPTGEVARRLLRADYAVLHALERKGYIVSAERERTVERGGSAFRLPELTPAQQLAGYIRSRSAAALVTAHAQLTSEVENADELLAQMPQDPQCEDIVSRTGAKDTYYYSSANMSDNYAMIAQLIEDRDLCVMFAEMVRFNARIYPSATPLRYFQRSPYGLAPDEIEQTWKTMQGRPEFADIEELTNNQNERFLFSTQYLTRRYAKAISDVDEFCD